MANLPAQTSVTIHPKGSGVQITVQAGYVASDGAGGYEISTTASDAVGRVTTNGSGHFELDTGSTVTDVNIRVISSVIHFFA